MTNVTLDIRLFGSPRIELDGVPIDVDTRKAIALLALLAVERSSHARDTLATRLWPEADQVHARAALRRTLSTLLGAIGGEHLEISREAIALRARPDTRIDVEEFRRCIELARLPTTPASAYSRALIDAIRLNRGEFLAGFSLRDSQGFDDWQVQQAEAYRYDLSWALERSIADQLERHEYAYAVEPAQRWVALDPLHEPAQRALIRAYAGGGHIAAALHQYAECVNVLDRELGVAPLAETTDLVESIRERRSAPFIPVTVFQTPHQPVVELVAPRSLPMVGRAVESERLIGYYRGIARDGKLVVLEGEAGVGKTRLSDEFAESIRAEQGVVLIARCYEGETDLAYGPIIELLRAGLRGRPDADWRVGVAPEALTEAARLLRDVDPGSVDAQADQLTGPGAQARFFDGCAQVLSALLQSGDDTGSAVILDDLHWADDATVEFLGWLVHQLEGRPFLLLFTWRGEEVPNDHPLRRMLATARRSGRGELLALHRLSRSDVSALVEAATGETNLAARLFTETEGLPFFLVEYLAEVDALSVPGQQQPQLPRGVREILRSRVSRAGEIGRQLLSAGAAIGRSFEFETLRAASGRSEEEVVDGIEALVSAGLLRESAGPGNLVTYDFSHEQLRSYVYAETSLARQRLLHRRIADALRARANQSMSATAAQIAYHLRLGGLDGDAAEQFRLAGAQARAVYAHSDALSHFQAALGLGHPDAGELHQEIGDLQTLLGDYSGAQASYAAALARAGATRIDLNAALEHRIGVLYQRRGEWARSISHFQSSAAALDQVGPTDLARLSADWSLSAYKLGDVAGASHLAQRALDLARASEDDTALVQAWNILGVLARARGDLHEAQRCLEFSRAIAGRLGDRVARAAALNNLALVRFAAGDSTDAIELALEALADCITAGDRHREAAIRNNLADFYHGAGRDDDSMRELTRSVSIFAEIGTIDGEPQPEIWKLVEW